MQLAEREPSSITHAATDKVRLRLKRRLPVGEIDEKRELAVTKATDRSYISASSNKFYFYKYTGHGSRCARQRGLHR